jgi:hypothetical protein
MNRRSTSSTGNGKRKRNNATKNNSLRARCWPKPGAVAVPEHPLGPKPQFGLGQRPKPAAAENQDEESEPDKPSRSTRAAGCRNRHHANRAPYSSSWRKQSPVRRDAEGQSVRRNLLGHFKGSLFHGRAQLHSMDAPHKRTKRLGHSHSCSSAQSSDNDPVWTSPSTACGIVTFSRFAFWRCFAWAC